jgi:hypothetical protein
MRRRDDRKNGVTGGILLIGLGVLLYTEWWWPGILIVLGVAFGAGLAFRGKYVPAVVVALISFTLAFFAQYMVPWDLAGRIALVTKRAKWGLAGPIALVAIGIIILANALLKGEEPEKKEETKTT